MKKHMLMLLAAAAMITSYSCTKPDVSSSGKGEGTEQEGNGNGENKNEEDEGSSKEPTTYKAGDYYKVGLAEGIVAYVDESGEHGLLISLDETRAAWSTVNEGLTNMGLGFSQSDGAINARIIKSLENWETNYPAFAWCDSKNALGLSAWYLPAMYELEYAYFGLEAINSTLTEMGETTISSDSGVNGKYWTSVEMGNIQAYAFSFHSGDSEDYYDTDKSREHRVRAMRKF